ncbi:MAG: thioredoxin family protein [Verrucomicrobiota bacterium]
MNIKSLINTCAVVVAVGLSSAAFAGGEGWISDFAAARKQAAESKEDLLVDFTGSDWCGWCIKLNKEVFSQEPFKTGVRGKFVLVELDYPKDKSKLSEATIKQNEELGKKYAVAGYPTILLCDAEGKPFASTGYQEGGPEAYVKHLDELRGNKDKRDAAFESAAKSDGIAKAKALVSALEAMDLTDSMVSNFYGDVVEQIKAADPKDETDFNKAIEGKARIAKFQAELGAFGANKDFDGALGLVDKTLKDGGFGVEETQQLMMTKAMILAQQKKFDEAIKAVDEAKAVAPDSKMNEGIDGFRKRLVDEQGKASGGAAPLDME